MKVNEFKRIEEGVFTGIVQALASREDPEAREQKIANQARPQFIADFKRDFEADFKKYKSQIKITKRAVTESYSTFNAVLESVISEQEPASNRTPLSQWIPQWFAAYMSGIDWKKSQAQVATIAQEIETNFSNTTQRDQAINKLAELAWTIAQDANKTPYGARNIATTSSTKLSDQQFIKMYNSDPELKAKLDAVASEHMRVRGGGA
jgi:hypothetical protein